MPDMPDPAFALKSFQQALLDGEIELGCGKVDKNIRTFIDKPMGKFRYTYSRLEGNIVTDFVMLAPVQPYNGARCYQIGYAVPSHLQNRGRAKELVEAALAETKHRLTQLGVAEFYVEAIIDKNNIASQRVAEATISNNSEELIDPNAGIPVLRYMRRIRLKII